ncbi:MAG: amino acid ABC transporter substrate-binding protein [Pseudomonadota bacterium]
MIARSVLAIAISVLLGSAAAASTLERVEVSGLFKIGFREDAAPFSYRNDAGEPAGYMVDLCRAVAGGVKRDLGLAEVEIAYVPVSAETRFDAIEEGRIDILCGPTTVTLERRERIDFSLPTFIDGASVLYKADGPKTFEALAGLNVGVRGGTTTQEALATTLKRMKLDAQIVAVADHADGLQRLEDGAIAAYFADQGILYHLSTTSADPQSLRISDRHFTIEPYALGMARGDTDFRLSVDRTLARIYRSGEIATLFRRSFGAGAAPSRLLQGLYTINQLPE